jgi:hypothetical protein
MSSTTARALELTMRSALMAALDMETIYTSDDPAERVLPAVALRATFQEDDYTFRDQNRYAETLELRASAIISRPAPDSARVLDAFAGRLRDAIETATITSGWNYLRIERTGHDRAVDDLKREYTHIYTVTAHPII